jgi:hypothetical protein
MDFTDALKAGGASATIITIIAVAVKLVQSICGHRIRSECCGHTASIGMNVENMSPHPKQPTEGLTTVVVRSARPSLDLETKDRPEAVVKEKPESKPEDLPIDLQARL